MPTGNVRLQGACLMISRVSRGSFNRFLGRCQGFAVSSGACLQALQGLIRSLGFAGQHLRLYKVLHGVGKGFLGSDGPYL